MRWGVEYDMGIKIVNKYSPKKSGTKKRVNAIVLAGGAVSGGSFMVGGVSALNSFFSNFSVNDFDIFVGVSSGSMIAAPLSAGIPPDSLERTLDGTSKHFSQLKPWHYYRPNFEEFIARPLSFIFRAGAWLPNALMRMLDEKKNSRGVGERVWKFLTSPSTENYKRMIERIDLTSIIELFPSGLFDNRALEEYFRSNIERNKLTNDFAKAHRITGKRLYICAMALDGAKQVVFGPDEFKGVTISQAIQASTALPGFYRPARIDGVDYVDGGVQESANVDVAVKKGAQLIVCYNPFRPYDADEFVDKFRFKAKQGRRVSQRGLLSVINQIFRAVYHSRLEVAIDKFARDSSFEGDIILIEPEADDVDFFMLNPLSLATRVQAAKYGYRSVMRSVRKKFDEIKKVMSNHGIKMHCHPRA